MAVRPKHLEKAHEAIAKGIIQFGGAFLTPESIASPTAEKKLVGSTMLIRASSFEEAKSIIESDVYWTNNVWDHEKLFIAPFLVATPDSFKI
ncbi:hypothetical protein JAAARDRAFT_42276 [Jaapia argillacea MUCL 33604]|uniref:YCII-related domain-containing protein n=1 Tax=Jaapia argillacea MUCL 33604 TaxID=933084 RepID=A0A067P8W5_9AGAM|nr:hypothetical protein JAAARDRAFT_42276 [Jaapia argillacea MUCL 33604]